MNRERNRNQGSPTVATAPAGALLAFWATGLIALLGCHRVEIVELDPESPETVTAPINQGLGEVVRPRRAEVIYSRYHLELVDLSVFNDGSYAVAGVSDGSVVAKPGTIWEKEVYLDRNLARPFVLKFDPGGRLIWGAFICDGAEERCRITDIEAASDGFLWVAGFAEAGTRLRAVEDEQEIAQTGWFAVRVDDSGTFAGKPAIIANALDIKDRALLLAGDSGRVLLMAPVGTSARIVSTNRKYENLEHLRNSVVVLIGPLGKPASPLVGLGGIDMLYHAGRTPGGEVALVAGTMADSIEVPMGEGEATPIDAPSLFPSSESVVLLLMNGEIEVESTNIAYRPWFEGRRRTLWVHPFDEEGLRFVGFGTRGFDFATDFLSPIAHGVFTSRWLYTGGWVHAEPLFYAHVDMGFHMSAAMRAEGGYAVVGTIEGEVAFQDAGRLSPDDEETFFVANYDIRDEPTGLRRICKGVKRASLARGSSVEAGPDGTIVFAGVFVGTCAFGEGGQGPTEVESSHRGFGSSILVLTLD